MQTGDGGRSPRRFLSPEPWPPAQGQTWRDGRGHHPPTAPPKGVAGRSPPLGQLKAEGGWAGGPDLPRGHRGVCAWETGVWEGGIYRLLFTKTRPRKTFNSSQLKGDSCGALTAPLTTHTGLCPPPPPWPAPTPVGLVQLLSGLPGAAFHLGNICSRCVSTHKPGEAARLPGLSCALGRRALQSDGSGGQWAPPLCPPTGPGM